MELKIVSPILGFEEEKKAKLQKLQDPFFKLHLKEASFILIDPVFLREYSFDLDEAYIKLLELKNPNDAFVLNIVILKDPFEDSLVNFLAPIIINKNKNLLAQVVLDEKKYPDFGLKEPIKKYLKKESS